jgi:hypothetical protein
MLTVLEAGYKVRGIVLNTGEVEFLKATKPLQAHLENVEFEIVPDITIPGAYDEVIKGVDRVLHLASPLPSMAVSGSLQ